MIHVAEPVLNGHEADYVSQCLANNQLTSGKFVERFEAEFARFVGTKHAVACSSGTAALHLALWALGVKEGDEVIVPALTFVATANAVRYCGARPVFADVLPDTWCIDPESVKRLITKRTVGIVPVHLYGNPADMYELDRIAHLHHLFLLEDAAEAHGATCGNLRVGNLGNAGTFSFYGNKIITTGEGGMVTTNNAEMAGRMRQLRGHCQVKPGEYLFDGLGFNYRLTDLQAAIGLGQLEMIDWHLRRRREVALAYRQKLGETFVMQTSTPDTRPAYWMTTVLVDKAPQVRNRLSKKGIETRPVFTPMTHFPMYFTSLRPAATVSERIAERGINLPSHARLSDEDIDLVCDALKEAVNE